MLGATGHYIRDFSGSVYEYVINEQWEGVWVQLSHVRIRVYGEIGEGRWRFAFNGLVLDSGITSTDTGSIIKVWMFRNKDNTWMVEEKLTGFFKKLINNDMRYVEVPPDRLEDQDKAAALAHFSLEFTEGEVLITDLQGVGLRWTDIEIATKTINEERYFKKLHMKKVKQSTKMQSLGNLVAIRASLVSLVNLVSRMNLGNLVSLVNLGSPATPVKALE
ncbi:hypothetical protein QZH41_003467 [Actinostola sp. cb2023]|nr:hypothetical protein QZH41_003467 [Actinostola sp. cb2023]